MSTKPVTSKATVEHVVNDIHVVTRKQHSPVAKIRVVLPGPLLMAALVGASAVAHAPALWATYVSDDRNDVVRNPSALSETFFARLPQTVRPLLKASYAAQDAIHGPSALGLHAVNLALHLVAVILLFVLIARALRLNEVTAARADRIAALTALVWSLHPALTETVTYISGRSMGLSSVLILVALLAATGRTARPTLAFAAALLAPLARETALVAPLLLAAWQASVDRKEPIRLQLLRAAPVWLGAAAAAAIIMGMPSHRDLVRFSLDQRAPLDALRANIFAVPEILRLWLEPWRISILPTQPVAYGWGDVATLMRLAGLGGTLLAAFTMRRRAPVAALAVFWTFVALVPTNSVIWRVDPVAAKPLYLAGIGLSLLLISTLAQLRRASWAAMALAALLGVMTFDRARLYSDEVALFEDAATKAASEARPQLMLGLVLANAGRFDEARAALETALQLDPFDPQARNALRLIAAEGQIYGKQPP